MLHGLKQLCFRLARGESLQTIASRTAHLSSSQTVVQFPHSPFLVFSFSILLAAHGKKKNLNQKNQFLLKVLDCCNHATAETSCSIGLDCLIGIVGNKSQDLEMHLRMSIMASTKAVNCEMMT